MRWICVALYALVGVGVLTASIEQGCPVRERTIRTSCVFDRAMRAVFWPMIFGEMIGASMPVLGQGGQP